MRARADAEATNGAWGKGFERIGIFNKASKKSESATGELW